jgi:hypothetical protein
MMIICPICLGIAEPVSWAKNAAIDLEECWDCGRIWAADDRQKLFHKYQIQGKGNRKCGPVISSEQKMDT